MLHTDRLLGRLENRNRLHIYGTTIATAGQLGGAGGAGTTGALAGLLSNPVTAIIGAGLGIVQLIFGIRAHHAAAVKNEAAALGSATGAVTEAYKGIFSGVTSGTITPLEASNAVDSIFPQYETLVYDQYKVKRKSGNGPDKIEQQLRDWATAFKNWLNGHSDSVTLEALDRHGDWKGQAAVTLTGTVPTPEVSTLTGAAATGFNVIPFLQKYWLLIAAVVIVFYLVKK